MSNPQISGNDDVQKVTVAEKQTTAGALVEAASAVRDENKRRDDKVATEKATNDEKVASEVRRFRLYEFVFMPLAVTILGTLQVIALAYIGRMDSKVDATHELVNSGSLIQLKLHAASAKRLAEITNDQRDIDAANLADKAVRDHEAKQAAVDAKR